MCILLLLILMNSLPVERMIIYKHIIVVNIHVSKLVRIYSYHSLMCTGLPRSIMQFQVQAVFVVRPFRLQRTITLNKFTGKQKL